jgi:hypothetical protein
MLNIQITEETITKRDTKISFVAWNDGHVLLNIYVGSATFSEHMTIQDLIEIQDTINKVLLNPIT